METTKFSLKPEEKKKRGNWKGKLAAALAGVLGASVIGPAITSFMPDTADAAETILYQNAGDPGEIRAGGASSRQDYNGKKMTVVRSAEQLRLAIQTAVSNGWTSADKELVIFVDNSMTTTYNDGSYDKDSGELNCFVMDKTIEIPANANIRLVSTAGNNVKFVRTSDFSGSDSMFRVKGKLTVGENITMSGELTTKTSDVSAVANQQQCDDGSTPGQVVQRYEYQDVQTSDGNLNLNGYIYNDQGKVLIGNGNDFGSTVWKGKTFYNVSWVDPAAYAGQEAKFTWHNAQKYATNNAGTQKVMNYLVNSNGWALVAKHDLSQLMITPERDLAFRVSGGDFNAYVLDPDHKDKYGNIPTISQVKTHVEVEGGTLKMGYYSGDGLVAPVNILGSVKKKVPIYYPEDRCANGQLPKTPVAGHPAGKKYGNSAAHTWDKSSSDGSYLNNNTGFFITQESGELTIDGGTFKDFNTVAGEGTYSKQPLGCAPIYVTNGKFTMNSGNIVNNTVGYTIGDDEYSGKEAQDIKNHVQTKPETYTAGAIIFTGGNDHQLNGGLIAGNKADAGAIIVKTKNNHPFASDPSFSGHNQLATWAASAAASSTKVTMGAGTSAGPTIAGNVGIHDSGAVFVWPVGDNDTAEVVMNAGKVQDNFSWYKGGAFNVCSEIDPIEHWKQDKKRANAKAIFDMNGGLIENNTAVCRGGAIEVVSDQVYLKAGIIRDNNSRTLGGAIYVEGDFADRLYTLYLPNTYVNNNNAWKETKAGQEASDYAYLKRKLVSGNRARLNADGTYTYDNPLGNVRNDNGSINDTDRNEGKKDWSPVSDGAKKWILSATRTGDWRDFPNHSGLGGGVWLCALGGYASINFFINDTNKPDLVGAYIDGNNGTKGNGQIDWDMTALAKDGGFTLSKANTNAQDQSEYVYLDRPSEHLVWNKLYSGKGARYDIVNSNNITTDNTQGGTKGVLITQNNARAGGGIASNGTVIFGQSGDIYRHSAETTFTKTWTGVASKPMAFQAYIIKPDGTKVAIPGYQFILDGTAGDAQGGNGSVQSVVDETSGWTAKIQLPYGYDGTPVFEMTADNKTYNTLMSLWDIPGSVTTGTVTDWNFAVEEVPSLPHKKTGLVASNNYFLLKKVDENSGSETDRDPNFKTDGKYDAPINIGAQTEWPYTNFPDKYKSGLYFVKQYNGVTEVNETLFNGEYALVQGNGNVIEEFTISEGETEFASYNLVEKPSTVKLSQTHKEVDYKDKEGKTITKIHEYSTKAYTEGDNNNLKMDNSEREKPGVEKYINKKVDQDLDNIGQQFTYDIIAKVPDQAEEFAISDTLVDWIEYVGGTEAIQIKVLDNNDHLGNGSGTVATGKVNNTGNSVVNQALTSQVNAACEKIILNDTLTVRVTDKTVLKNLIGKYVQITIDAQLDSDHYDDVMGKVSNKDRKVTYNEASNSYKLRNEFDKNKYTYRVYRVSDKTGNNIDGDDMESLTWNNSLKRNAGYYLTDEELKAIGISADTIVRRTQRVGHNPLDANFDNGTFKNLPAGKYVVHVMNGTEDDGTNGEQSKSRANLDLCEVFEIIDGNEDISWVSVAGTSQNGLPEAFKNDSPYMGEGKQQTDPQVVTGSTTDKKNTSDDPLHDGVGNRATFTVTYRGGRQQTLKTNTVTVEPQPETPKIEKYVNKKVDDTLAGFDSNFTYDIMAYIPNGVSTVVIDDTLVDWLEFASTDNTLNQIRVLSDNDHIGNGSGTVATGSVNGNTKVVDVALDNKYTVEKTGNKLKVTINDRDTITKLWGNWVQVTFDAKIKESAYGNVMSKLREKEAASDDRATVTYSKNVNNTNRATYVIKDYEADHASKGVHYRLYRISVSSAGQPFFTANTWGVSGVSTSNAGTILPENARDLFGIQESTSIVRTKKIDEEQSAQDGSGEGKYSGNGKFENLIDGKYLLYCWTGSDERNSNNVLLNKCEYFEVSTQNFNWVEVDGSVTTPAYLSTDAPVLDGADAMHDGIGNRAGYTLGFKGGSTTELKTNVVTVEPKLEKFEITKIWEGDDVTAPSGEVETEFLKALKLKLGGEDIPANTSYDHELRITSIGANGRTWTIETPSLPTFESKKYSLEENLQSLKNSSKTAVKNFFKYYDVSYSNSVNESYTIKDIDTERYAYYLARGTNKNSPTSPFDELSQQIGANGSNMPAELSELFGSFTKAERIYLSYEENGAKPSAEVIQSRLNNILNSGNLPSGDYVLLCVNRSGWIGNRERSERFTYQAPESFADQISKQLVDKYGNTKLHDNTITIAAGADRKLLSGTNHGDGWVVAKPGDTDHLREKYGITPVYINDAYWGYDITNYVGPGNFSSKVKTNPVVVDLDTLPSGTYFDLTYNGGFGNSRRRYDIVGSERLNTVKYSVYKKGSDGVEGKTLGSVIGTDYKYSNGLAYEATDAQKAYGLYKKDISRDDLTNAITDDGEFIIVAQNNAERIIPITLKKRFSDGNLASGGTLYNTKKLFKVVIRKIDPNYVDLSGATFELRKNNSSGEKVILENSGSYFTTGTVLEPGTYYVKETKAPKGYTAVNEFTFKLNNDGSVSDISNTSNGRVSVDDDRAFVINAKNTTDTTEIDVTKKWDYSSGERREKPNSITIYLDSDAENQDQFKVYRSYTIDKPNPDSDTWTYKIDNLPKYVYKADGVTIDRTIQYRIREGDVHGYINSSVEMEVSSTSGSSSGGVDNTTYYAYSTYDKGNGSYIGSQIHYLQTSKGYNNPKIPAFCINYPVQGPNTFENSYYYNPLEYKKVVVGSSSDLANYIVSSKYAQRSNGIRFGNEPLDNLYKRLIVINLYGYGNDTTQFKTQYGLTDSQFKWMTQCAIFEYADWYGTYRGTDFSNKANKVFALDNGLGGERPNVNIRKADGSNITLHQAYRDFMRLIHNADLTTLTKNKQLYLYIPKSTSNLYRYQNLIGVEDIPEVVTNTKVTLVNKSLADLTIQKVDEEGKPIQNKNDLEAEFRLVEALDAEDAKEKAKTTGIVSVPVEGDNSALYKFPGVKTGRYWLVETKSPKYYTIGEPVEIKVTSVESSGNNGANNNSTTGNSGTGNDSTGNNSSGNGNTGNTGSNTGNTQGKTYKALTYLTGSRNVGLTDASDNDTYSYADDNKMVWTTTQDGEITIIDANNKTRYLVYDIETISSGAEASGTNYYPLTCAFWSPMDNDGEPDEGGQFGISPYTGSANRYPVWKYNNGKLKLDKYRNVDGGKTETIYLSNLEYVRTADTIWDYGTATLQGTLTESEASTVVLQTWNGSKWVNASGIQPNKEYRILLEEGTGFVPITPSDPGSGSGTGTGSGSGSSGSNTELQVEFVNPDLVENIAKMSEYSFGVSGFHFSYMNELTKVELPDTGGMGTTWIYIIGGAAAAGGITAIAARGRRKKKTDQDIA